MVGLTEKAESCWDSDLQLRVCVQFGRTRETVTVSKGSLMGRQREAGSQATSGPGNDGRLKAIGIAGLTDAEYLSMSTVPNLPGSQRTSESMASAMGRGVGLRAQRVKQRQERTTLLKQSNKQNGLRDIWGGGSLSSSLWFFLLGQKCKSL